MWHTTVLSWHSSKNCDEEIKFCVKLSNTELKQIYEIQKFMTDLVYSTMTKNQFEKNHWENVGNVKFYEN